MEVISFISYKIKNLYKMNRRIQIKYFLKKSYMLNLFSYIIQEFTLSSCIAFSLY